MIIEIALPRCWYPSKLNKWESSLRRLHLEILVSVRKIIAPMVQAMSLDPERDAALALEWKECVRVESPFPVAEIGDGLRSGLGRG